LRDDLIVELAKRGSADLSRIRAVRGMERGDLQRQLPGIAAAIQRGLDLPEEECPVRAAREQTSELSVLGQFLFAALGSICREARLSPNLVGTPNDIRQWVTYRSGHGRDKSAAVPRLARGWRADFVGRLFEDLLAGDLAVRVADPSSDHPLTFQPVTAGGEPAPDGGSRRGPRR
jgi:ribonuclease D